MRKPVSDYIFSLDQSIASSAWCLFYSNGRLIAYDVIKTSKKEGTTFKRCDIIANTLLEYIEKNNLINTTTFCREGLGFGNSNSNASRDLAYLVGMIEGVIGREFNTIAPTSLKKFATGNGRADKQDMIDALPCPTRERFVLNGYKKTTGLSDLADAYFIGKYFLGGDI